MSYIKIMNKGEIDINALTLLGASSKAGDTGKIGFFGSGNKYALATFLRNGIGVRIFSGTQEFVITTENVNFRGQEFSRITINGIQTSLTTRTGPEWKVWMALREFICNAIDEGEESWGSVEEVETPPEGKTAIYLEETKELSEIFDDIESIVINDEPIEKHSTVYGDVAIYDRSLGRVYRKGICCYDQFTKGLFSYSFDDISINESRIVTSEYLIHERIVTALAMTTDSNIVQKVMLAMLSGDKGSQFLEARILEGDYWSSNYCHSVLSVAWRDWVLSRLQVCCPKAYLSFIPQEDSLTYLVLPDGFYDRLIIDWPEIPHIGEGSTEWAPADEPPELSRRVYAALNELKELGLTGDTAYQIKWVNFVDDSSVMSTDHKNTTVIMVSAREHEDINYAAGLLEEITHKTTGFGDGSRKLQTYLFNRWYEAEKNNAKSSAFYNLVKNAMALS